jgi:hypothetical protein
VAALERGASMNGLIRELEAERQGQLALDFQHARTDRTPAKVVALPTAVPPAASLFPQSRIPDAAAANQAMAAKYFLDGAELDDGENRDLDAAAAAYRRAALFDPLLVPAVVNLANITTNATNCPKPKRYTKRRSGSIPNASRRISTSATSITTWAAIVKRSWPIAMRSRSTPAIPKRTFIWR